MFKNRGIKARHCYVWLGKNISIFLEEGFVGGDFFRSACGANGGFIDDSIFYGNIDFDGRGNVGHISFFKSIRGRDRVVEPVYMP
jgi:hypothetical protein